MTFPTLSYIGVPEALGNLRVRRSFNSVAKGGFGKLPA
jgi:hypothetical protein